MPIGDFIFQGSAPPSVNTYGNSSTQIPSWMSDYVQGLVGRANQIADTSLQQPNFARVAGFTPDQQASFDATRGVQSQSQGLIDQAAKMPGSAAAAAPYMARAGATTPDVINNYMSPYTKNVTDVIGKLAGRNLSENLLPQVNDTFTKAGMFGGTRNNEFTERAVRDSNEAALNAQSLALQQGYTQAQTAAGADTDRAARAGQLAGQLTDADRARLLSTAATGSNVGLQGASALSGIGGQQQGLEQQNINVALSDFLEARGYPKEQVNFLTSAIRGVPYSQSSSTSSTGPANAYQPSLFSNLAGAGLSAAALSRAFPGLFSGIGSGVSNLFSGAGGAASSIGVDPASALAAGIIPMKKGGEVRGGEEMLGPDEGPLEGERLRKFIESHGIDMRRLYEQAFPGPIARKGYRDGGPVRRPQARGALRAA